MEFIGNVFSGKDPGEEWDEINAVFLAGFQGKVTLLG